MGRLYLMVLLLGCHQEAAQPQPPAAPSQCARVADHIVGLMAAESKVAGTQLDPFRSVIAKRCDQDHWSAEAQQCLGAIKTLDDGDACEKMLTPEQAKALERDGQAAVGAMGGASYGGASEGAEPPPPPPPPPSGAEAPTPAPPMQPAPRSKAAPNKTSDPCEGGR